MTPIPIKLPGTSHLLPDAPCLLRDRLPIVAFTYGDLPTVCLLTYTPSTATTGRYGFTVLTPLLTFDNLPICRANSRQDALVQALNAGYQPYFFPTPHAFFAWATERTCPIK